MARCQVGSYICKSSRGRFKTGICVVSKALRDYLKSPRESIGQKKKR